MDDLEAIVALGFGYGCPNRNKETFLSPQIEPARVDTANEQDSRAL